MTTAKEEIINKRMNFFAIIIIIICMIPSKLVAFSTKQVHHFQLPKSLVCQNNLLRQSSNVSTSYNNREEQRKTFELQLSKHTEEDDVMIPKSLTNAIDDTNDRTIGILILLTVPLAWGTYAPVVKYMYNNMEPSMPGFIFSAGYYIVAALTLGILSSLSADDSDSIVVDVDGGRVTTEDNGNNDNIISTITTRGGLELGSYLFLGNGLQVVGLQTVPADRAGE